MPNAYSPNAYILRALDRDGRISYYTGKAGEGWVHSDPSLAFVYENLVAAQVRAMRHNKHEPLHGLWFVPVLRASAVHSIGAGGLSA
jgi:hypothetical protein